jgi:hypothetical protein
MFSNNTGSTNTFDITEVGHIERVVVGSVNPEHVPSEAENQAKLDRVNRCLSGFPKGKIIGTERSFSIIRIGEHQVVLETMSYHIGFKKKPLWIDEEASQKQNFAVDTDKIKEIIENQ